MTRINAFIAPSELTDKHLLAEHREIKRIPNTIKTGKDIINDIPKKFTLSKGHVKFFYNKVAYLYYRYQEIYNECQKRGFNVTPYYDAFIFPDHDEDDMKKIWKPYKPTKADIAIILERLIERDEKHYCNLSVEKLYKFVI